VHLSEQRAENEACMARHGLTPTQLLESAGLLGTHVTAVHATHLSDEDRTALGDRQTGVCFCPTTERDLGDGIGPGRALADAGVRLSLGSDSHAIVDGFEEWRTLELNERLASRERGRFHLTQLFSAATDHASIGWPEVGRIHAGAAADLVTVDLDSVRTAGADPGAALYAATASDIREVLIAGKPVVSDHRHLRLEQPETVLRDEIRALTQP
jgi:cytosine/adenosine deaminase-related metal-dependent hydrolase